jgi:hypothetical protein
MATKKAKPKKKVKKIIKKAKPVPLKGEKLVGIVTHYFDKIKVAVIKAKKDLKLKDKLHFIGGEDTDFKQVIASMQYNHEKIKKALKGKEFGMKVSKVVREGYKIFK